MEMWNTFKVRHVTSIHGKGGKLGRSSYPLPPHWYYAAHPSSLRASPALLFLTGRRLFRSTMTRPEGQRVFESLCNTPTLNSPTPISPYNGSLSQSTPNGTAFRGITWVEHESPHGRLERQSGSHDPSSTSSFQVHDQDGEQSSNDLR